MDCVISTLIIVAILSLFALIIYFSIFGGIAIKAALGFIGLLIPCAAWAGLFANLLK